MKVIEQAVYKESEREPGNQCSASPGAATEGGGPMCQVDHTITLSTYCRSYYHPFYILQIILSSFLHIVDHSITLSTYCNHTITLSTYCWSYYHPFYLLWIILSPLLHIVDHTITLATYCRSYYPHFYIFSHHLYHSSWKARRILRALVSLISYHWVTSLHHPGRRE